MEGKETILPGSWVAQGVAGEMRPVRQDIFHTTYRPLADA